MRFLTTCNYILIYLNKTKRNNKINTHLSTYYEIYTSGIVS